MMDSPYFSLISPAGLDTSGDTISQLTDFDQQNHHNQHQQQHHHHHHHHHHHQQQQQQQTAGNTMSTSLSPTPSPFNYHPSHDCLDPFVTDVSFSAYSQALNCINQHAVSPTTATQYQHLHQHAHNHPHHHNHSHHHHHHSANDLLLCSSSSSPSPITGASAVSAYDYFGCPSPLTLATATTINGGSGATASGTHGLLSASHSLDHICPHLSDSPSPVLTRPTAGSSSATSSVIAICGNGAGGDTSSLMIDVGLMSGHSDLDDRSPSPLIDRLMNHQFNGLDDCDDPLINDHTIEYANSDSSLSSGSSGVGGSNSIGSSDCSINAGNVYGDIITSNSIDYYTNHYYDNDNYINDCSQGDMLMTSQLNLQQQQHLQPQLFSSNSSSNNNFKSSTAYLQQQQQQQQQLQPSSKATTTTTGKQSVLMNLLIDGSDIGAGYTSINSRALQSRSSASSLQQQQNLCL